MRAYPVLVAALVASAACPASAQEHAIDVPAGTLADSAIALARQTKSSIVVNGSSLSSRRVARIRGTMSAEAAVQRLARQANARAVRISAMAWRLDPLPARTARQRSETRGAKVERRPRPSSAPPPVAPPTEIVVTASKRDLPLKEMPAQVSMIDGEELALGGVGGTEKITQRVATVSSTYLGSGRNKLFIRGIADSSFTGPTQATVGQYLGDIRLS